MQNRHREELAKRTQKNLEEMGCIPPPAALRRHFSAEKKAPIDTMEVVEVVVTDEEVLKYGRRVAMLMAANCRPVASPVAPVSAA